MEANLTQGTQSSGEQSGGQQPPVTTPIATQNQTTQQVTAEPPRTISEQEVQELVSKVREDEKKKVYGKLDEMKAALKDAKSSAKALEDQLAAARADLDAVRQGKSTEIDSITKELASMRERSAKLESALEEVSSNAAQKLRESELRIYRERRVRESGVELIELVQGDSEEAIEQSIKVAIDKEKAIRDKVRGELQVEFSKHLPAPLAPDGSQGRGPTDSSAKDREKMAKLKGPEYEKHRARLLEEAKQKTGLV